MKISDVYEKFGPAVEVGIVALADEMLAHPEERETGGWYEWGLWDDGYLEPWFKACPQFETEFHDYDFPDDDVELMNRVTVGVLRREGAEKYTAIIEELERINEEGI